MKEETRTKVENDRLGRLLNSLPTTKIRSSQFSVSATISKRPFHELEFLGGGGWWVMVVGGWVCKPILVISFAQADQ